MVSYLLVIATIYIHSIFADICSVDKCHDALNKCQKDDSCKDLLNMYKDKCSDVVQSNFSMCSDDCKQAIHKIYGHPIGYKLKCCDCGMAGHQEDTKSTECFIEQSNIIDHCNVNDDDCVDCKVKGNENVFIDT